MPLVFDCRCSARWDADKLLATEKFSNLSAQSFAQIEVNARNACSSNDKVRNFIPIREDSPIGKSVYRKEKGTVIEVEPHDNRKITTLITNTRAPNLEEMKVIADLFHSATTIIGDEARSIKVHDRWATGSYDRFQDGARDDMNAICGTCKALLFSTSHLKGCKFFINP